MQHHVAEPHRHKLVQPPRFRRLNPCTNECPQSILLIRTRIREKQIDRSIHERIQIAHAVQPKISSKLAHPGGHGWHALRYSVKRGEPSQAHVVPTRRLSRWPLTFQSERPCHD